MGKCYNISFDSTSYYGGGNNNKRTYFVDWNSILPQNKKFKVSFCFMSVSGSSVAGAVSVMSLLLNLGGTNNFWANGNGIISTQYLGALKISQTAAGTNGYYYADKHSNLPVYLNSRPTQNLLEVQLHAGLDVTNNFTSPVPFDYVLSLCFEEDDE